MPKQMRWEIKRELDNAAGNLDSAINKILTVAKPFEHVHDDYLEKFVMIVAAIHTIKEVIKQIRDEI